MNEKLCVDPAAALPWIMSSIFVCFQWIPFSDGLTKQQRDPRRSHQFPSTQGPSAVSKAQEHTPPHADAGMLQPISCILSFPLPRQSSLVDAPADVCRVCTATLTDTEGLRALAFCRARAKHGGSLCSELTSDHVDNRHQDNLSFPSLLHSERL